MLACRCRDPGCVAALLDDTLLKPEATPLDVAALAEEAGRAGTATICISPNLLPVASPVPVCTVVGFPSGAHGPAVKAREAELAVAAGAVEFDMVVDLAGEGGDSAGVTADVASVVDGAGPALVKVIIEAAALTDDEIVACCRAAEAAGAGYVKTSTGFHPAGGHTVHAVELMAATVGGRLGVKASGGVRTTEQALAVVAAGATRIGCSASASILDGFPADGAP